MFPQMPTLNNADRPGDTLVPGEQNTTTFYYGLRLGVDFQLSQHIDCGLDAGFTLPESLPYSVDPTRNSSILYSSANVTVGTSLSYLLGRQDIGGYQTKTGRIRISTGAILQFVTLQGKIIEIDLKERRQGPTIEYLSKRSIASPYLGISYSDHIVIENGLLLMLRFDVSSALDLKEHFIVWEYPDMFDDTTVAYTAVSKSALILAASISVGIAF